MADEQHSNIGIWAAILAILGAASVGVVFYLKNKSATTTAPAIVSPTLVPGSTAVSDLGIVGWANDIVVIPGSASFVLPVTSSSANLQITVGLKNTSVNTIYVKDFMGVYSYQNQSLYVDNCLYSHTYKFTLLPGVTTNVKATLLSIGRNGSLIDNRGNDIGVVQWDWLPMNEQFLLGMKFNMVYSFDSNYDSLYYNEQSLNYIIFPTVKSIGVLKKIGTLSKALPAQNVVSNNNTLTPTPIQPGYTPPTYSQPSGGGADNPTNIPGSHSAVGVTKNLKNFEINSFYK